MDVATRTARLATALALVFAIAAVVTPAGRSGHQDLGARGASQASERTDAPDAFERYLHNNAPSAVRPDDRAGTRGVGALSGGDPSDAFSRYLANNKPDNATDRVASGTGFDWSDAGLGVAGTLGILLLAALTALRLQGRRGRLTTS